MRDAERTEIINAMKIYTINLKADKEASKAFLSEIGMLTKSGNLKKEYLFEHNNNAETINHYLLQINKKVFTVTSTFGVMQLLEKRTPFEDIEAMTLTPRARQYLEIKKAEKVAISQTKINFIK